MESSFSFGDRKDARTLAKCEWRNSLTRPNHQRICKIRAFSCRDNWLYLNTARTPRKCLPWTNATYSLVPSWKRRTVEGIWGGHIGTTRKWISFWICKNTLEMQCIKGCTWRKEIGRVGVVAITLASHARGREFNPRIRYFFIFSFFHFFIFSFFHFFYKSPQSPLNKLNILLY